MSSYVRRCMPILAVVAAILLVSDRAASLRAYFDDSAGPAVVGSLPSAIRPGTLEPEPSGAAPEKQVACGCVLWCRQGSTFLAGCKNVNDCETCCNLWEARICGCYEDRVCGGGFATVAQLPLGRLRLAVQRNAPDPANPVPGTLTMFPIPGGVNLKPGVFASREALERYLLERYVGSVPVPPSPRDPARPDCVAGRAPGATSGAPRLMVVLPTSGAPGEAVAVAGTGFGAGATPYFGDAASVPLFGFEERNIPLIGAISIGFTIVPPAAKGSADVFVEHCGSRSNAFPFVVR